MLSPRNFGYLYKYLILRFVRPTSPPHSQRESQVTRLNHCPITANMLISVDGNISSGKSSLVSKLVEHMTQLAACYHYNGLKGQNDIVSNQNPYKSATNGHGHGHVSSKSPSPSFELEVIPEPLEWNKEKRVGIIFQDPWHVVAVPEPLDKWCNLKGFNLLELFYKDPKKYNFVFQHYVQLTRLMDTVTTNSKPTSKPKIRIMERSLQNNRYCFLELARKSEQLEAAEFTVLTEWYSWLEANMDLHLDLVIYLRTTPEVAYQRMMNRGRAEESSCPLSYLAALHESYEDWLIRDSTRKQQQVIVIDANQTKEKVVADCIEELSKFLSSKNSVKNGVHKIDSPASPQKCVHICKE